MGIGNWAWGDRVFWGGRNQYGESDSRAAFTTSLDAGIRLVDTAEIYGIMGRAEALLGQFMHENGSGSRVIVATKFFPYPWRFRKGQLLRALRSSLRRLGIARVDLYQIHWPPGVGSIEFWADALADAVDAGLVKAVGVSNYSAAQMQRTADALAKRGLRLASNQVHYSLLQRAPERNGVLAACEALDARLIAYSPLAQGLLTGKYSPENLPAGLRRRRFRESVARVQPLVALMKEIGAAHDGRTPSQVALNWTMCKGTLPIPGVRNARQAEQNAGALGWRLTADEVAALDALSERVV